MAILEALKIWKETSYGVFANPGSPVANVDYVIPRLDQSNAYTVRKRPKRWDVRGFDGGNKRVQTGSSQFDLAGNFNTLLYPSQAQFFMNWAFTDVSCTVDHLIVKEGGAGITYTRHLGVKVGQYGLAASSDQVLFRQSFQLTGQQPASITGTDFPTPAFSAYPSDQPYVFQHMSTPGFLELGGTNRPEFSGWELTAKNLLDGTFNQSPYITRLKLCGRDVDWTDRLVFLADADRAAYEGVTASTCKAVINNGTHSITFDFQANSFPTAAEDDLPLDKVFYQALTWAAYQDPSSGTDLVVTVA